MARSPTFEGIFSSGNSVILRAYLSLDRLGRPIEATSSRHDPEILLAAQNNG
jgi:hypothetical protein